MDHNAQVIPFPTSAVIVVPMASCWLVQAPNGHAWIHGSRDAALIDAADIASTFNASVRVLP